MGDIAKRVNGRVQITTDQLRTYLNVVEDAFGGQADYAQLHKIYRASGDPDNALFSGEVHRMRDERSERRA